jgi:Bacterial Ig domain
VDRTICTDTGFLASETTACNKASAKFVEGAFPRPDNNHLKLRVSDCGGVIKLASQADELAGVARDQIFVRYETNIRNPDGSPNAFFQKQIDDYAVKAGFPLPPTETCTDPRTGDGSLIVQFISPSAGAAFEPGGVIPFRASSIGTGTMRYYFDNNLVGESTTAPYEVNYTIPVSTTGGAHSIKAVFVDSAGKTGQISFTIFVSVNIDSATINITNPNQGQVVLPNSLNFTANVNDPTGSINSVVFTLKFPNGTEQSFAGSKSGSNYTATRSLSGAGTYEVYAVASNGTATKQSNTITFTKP